MDPLKRTRSQKRKKKKKMMMMIRLRLSNTMRKPSLQINLN